MATHKLHVNSYSWDKESYSVDVDVYSSGGATYTVEIVTTGDDGAALYTSKTFVGKNAYQRATDFVKGMRDEN